MMAMRRGLADVVDGDVAERDVEGVKKFRSERAANRGLCRPDSIESGLAASLQSTSIKSPFAVKNAALTTWPT